MSPSVPEMEGIYMPLGASFFEDVPLVELIYLVFTRFPGCDSRRFRSLLLCPLSVERYYFPLFVDSGSC